MRDMKGSRGHTMSQQHVHSLCASALSSIQYRLVRSIPCSRASALSRTCYAYCTMPKSNKHESRQQVVGVTGHQKGKHTYRWYTVPPEVLAAARAARPMSRIQTDADAGELTKVTPSCSHPAHTGSS